MATIRRIDNIEPIPEADAIEVATVGGWKVVIQKGLYNIGDLVVFAEIDSWIPNEIAPFLSKGKEPREFNGVKGERLRTVKLRGTLSQGLILPLFPYRVVNVETRTVEWKSGLVEKFAEVENVANRPYPVWIENITEEGYYIEPARVMDEVFAIDLSERLNIQKYEAPIPACLAGKVKGNFPSFIPKTDQERIQNLTKQFESYKRYTFEVTEKLDGSSCTIYYNNGVTGVCSRNLDLSFDENNTFWATVIKYDIISKLEKLGRNIAIQGELCGNGIQGNKYAIQGHNFYVFDIYDIDSGKYLSSLERTDLVLSLDLYHVPFFAIEYTDITDKSIEDILTLAEGKSILEPTTEREGIVFKCVENTDISFKAISNKFLLKSGD